MSAAPAGPFRHSDTAQFEARVRAQLGLLGEILRDPDFGGGPTTFGSEVEVVLLDADGRPACVSQPVIAAAKSRDLPVTTELLDHQFEINGRVHWFAGRPFSNFGTELTDLLQTIAGIAATYGGQLGLMGILPTLTRQDAVPEHFSNNPRYLMLDAGLSREYPRINLDLQGQQDRLRVNTTSVAIEGANTSLQVHLSVPPGRFAEFYNAAQIATGLAVAVACGSPWLFGQDLWAENRIPVFEAATRGRAYFGSGWLQSNLDAFNVSLQHPQLLAFNSARPDHELAELQLSHHSVHPWNRAVVTPVGRYHGLRIEFRALPAGPTVADMAANAAFITGLTLALVDEPSTHDWIARSRSFAGVKANFYAAAQQGLEAKLIWPQHGSLQKYAAHELALRLLPHISSALVNAGVNRDEAERQLGVIAQRVRSRQTAATWLRQAGHQASMGANRLASLKSATSAYLDLSQNGVGLPVGQWPVP